jgi:glycosyltransferase involved in cell wall biosynthesis
MAMGIPVITNSGVGDVADIVTKYNAGYILNDFSEKSFNEVIEMILAGNTFDSTAIRNGASKFYALKNAVDQYRKVYDRIFSCDDNR